MAATGVVVDEEPVPSPRIAIDEGGRRLVTGRRRSVAVFDILDGSSTTMSGRHSSAVIDSSFSSDGKLDRLGATTARPSCGTPQAASPAHPRGHTAKISRRLSPDGRTLYTAGLDGATIAWDLAGSRLLGRSFPLRPVAPRGACLEFQDEGPAIAATSPDGRPAVLEGGTAVAVHDLETANVSCDARSRGAGGALAWSPTARRSRPRAHRTNRVERDEWSARSYMGAPVEIPADVALPGTPNGAEAVAQPRRAALRRRSAMGTSACGTRSPARRSASRWEPRRKISKVLPRTSPSLPTLSCSPRPLSILTGGGAAVAWRVSDGKELFTLNIDDGYGRGSAVAFTPDGKLLAMVEGPGRSSSGTRVR